MRRVITFLLCVVAFSVPWEEFVRIPEIGTIARLVSYVALGLVPFAFLFSPRFRVPKLIHFFAAGFLLWSLATMLWTVNMELTIQRIGIYARTIGLSWMFWEYTPTLKSQKRVMLAFILGGLFAIGNQFFTFLTMGSVGDEIARVSGGKLNANDLAYILVVTMVFAFYLATDPKCPYLMRIFYWSYAVLAAVGDLLTASRMGAMLLALCFVALFFWLLMRNATMAFLLLVFMGLSLAAAVMWFLPKENIERLMTTKESLSVQGSGSDRMGGRFGIWEAALVLARRNPIFGYGAGVFEVVIKEEYHHPLKITAHNSYISILVGTGVIGLFFFVAVQACPVFYAWGLPKGERLAWLLLLGILYISSMALGLEASKTIWMSLGLVASHADTVAREAAKAVAGPLVRGRRLAR